MFNSWKLIGLLFFAAVLLLAACDDDEMPCPDCPGDDIIEGPYDPQAYNLDVPEHLPDLVIAADNPLTIAGVELGRMLFYDPILSGDSTMSCSSCHLQDKAFTDGLALSVGILGLPTRRSSMALINLGMNSRGLFWDGRALTLEEQALEPVITLEELNDTWDNVEDKLRRHPDYPARFRAAFGIDRRPEITRDLAVKAITQFEQTLISGNSKYDDVVWRNEGEFTDQEEMGYELFKVETSQALGHPGCTHCHGEPQLTDNNYKNNGIEEVESLDDFPDIGRGAVTDVFDNGLFRTPTLRNIALTAPYMHDGRFATLEEVLDHYASGGHSPEFSDVNIRPFDMTEEEKQAILAFLHTLTDTSFVNNPAFSNPF